jgi:probable F420-dependent oxidoreductase
VAITLPVEAGLSASALVELGRRAEAEGFDYVVCGEVSSVDALVLLGAIAVQTTSIKLATGIVATTIRTPQLAAMGFATVSSLAPGRVVAGIGASSPIIVEKWHGLSFGIPLTTTREFIEVFRAATSQKRVDYRGSRFRSEGFQLQLDPAGTIPVWLGAINARMLELAGEAADGVFLTWCPPAEVGGRLSSVHRGALASARDLRQIQVVCSFWAYAGTDVGAAIESARRIVLQYAMVPTHQHAFLGSFPDLARAADAWNSGDRKAALRSVTDDVVMSMCAIGTPVQVANRISEYHDSGVDVAVLLPIATERGEASGIADTYFLVADELRHRGVMRLPESVERAN